MTYDLSDLSYLDAQNYDPGEGFVLIDEWSGKHGWALEGLRKVWVNDDSMTVVTLEDGIVLTTEFDDLATFDVAKNILQVFHGSDVV